MTKVLICWLIHILILIQNWFINCIYTIYCKVFFDHDQKTWQSCKQCCSEITARFYRSLLIKKFWRRLSQNLLDWINKSIDSSVNTYFNFSDRINWYFVIIDKINWFLSVIMTESINTAVIIRCIYLLTVLLDEINWFHLIWEYNITINILSIRDSSWLN